MHLGLHALPTHPVPFMGLWELYFSELAALDYSWHLLSDRLFTGCWFVLHCIKTFCTLLVCCRQAVRASTKYWSTELQNLCCQPCIRNTASTFLHSLPALLYYCCNRYLRTIFIISNALMVQTCLAAVCNVYSILVRLLCQLAHLCGSSSL